MKRAVKLTAAILTAAAVILSPSPAYGGGEYEGYDDRDVLHEHQNASMKIALTFDDGPHSSITGEILDILGKYGVRATFFVVGENVKYHPGVIRRMIAEGHEIGNHTYTHPIMKRYGEKQLADEITLTEDGLYEVCEYRPKLFRPPGGSCGKEVVAIAKSLDYTVILWTIDTRDWQHKKPEVIAQNVLENIDSGDIILCHDFIYKDSPTPEALEIFIPELLNRGYRFVTVSELIMSN